MALLFISVMIRPLSTIVLAWRGNDVPVTPVFFLPFIKSSTQVFQWGAVASWGLAATSFSFFRTLDDYKSIQGEVRFVGMGFLKGSLYSLFALAASFGVVHALEGQKDFEGNPILASWGDPFLLILTAFWAVSGFAAWVAALNNVSTLLELLRKGVKPDAGA